MDRRTKANRLCEAWFFFGAPIGFFASFALGGVGFRFGWPPEVMLSAMFALFVGITAVGYRIDIGKRVWPWLDSDA